LLEQQEKRETVIRNYGVVEWGRRTIAANLVSNPSLEDEIWQNQYLERLARFPVNGAIHAIRFVTRTVVPGQEGTKDLTMPTLIVIGEEDEGCIRGAEWLRDTIPRRRYVLLTKAGHGTLYYRPEAWRKAVEDFLNHLEEGKDTSGEIIL
jgi:pimeloyl-ACP methyl ester carboxylesterase